MEYAALFVWLFLCLVLGAVIHSAMGGALSHRFVQVLAAPGLMVRKSSMTLAALLCGATVTRVNVYELSSRDIDYRAEGVPSIAKVLVPLAPLFGAAVAAIAVNAMFGRPLRLEYAPPALSSLDTGGLRGFVTGTWTLLSSVVRQALSADWGNARLYVLFALLFSLALGAASTVQQVREAVIGAGLVALALALLSSIAVRRAGVVAATPGWFAAMRSFVVGSSAAAFVMMIYGLMGALVVGCGVRVYELLNRPRIRRPARTRRIEPEEHDAAA